MAKNDPYFVEVDVNGCERCHSGKTWTVVGPDGVAIGQSFEDKTAADELADYMNEGFWCGARNGFKAGFVAHPEAEAPVFKWSFDPLTCAAGDREASAWEAWESEKSADAVARTEELPDTSTRVLRAESVAGDQAARRGE